MKRQKKQPIETPVQAINEPPAVGAAETVEAIRGECLSLGWQPEQLDELQRLLASKDKMKVPYQVGMICKQSIEIQYLHQDGRIRGCGRYYNQRVKQPWNDLPE